MSYQIDDMVYHIKDEFYQRIEKKIEDGIFTKGKNCKLAKYYYKGLDISNLTLDQRTPEVCSGFMDYGKCSFADVPESSRTREFFIHNFSNRDVYNYIRDHIDDFDRQFFKDIIESNQYATYFDTNCFSIMPLEYIDEEMCSLAILNSTHWISDNWFYSVYERNPEALTADLWKLGARLYARMIGEKNKFLEITPEEYKDEEYYKEMCRGVFNFGILLSDHKEKIMDSLPEEVLTPEFLLDLLSDNINSIAWFNEKALETNLSEMNKEQLMNIVVANVDEVKWIHLLKQSGDYYHVANHDQDEIRKSIMSITEDIVDSDNIWQFVIRIDGHLIRNLPLNDERAQFFLRYYDEDSYEYRLSFRKNYQKYLKQKKENNKVLIKNDEN